MILVRRFRRLDPRLRGDDSWCGGDNTKGKRPFGGTASVFWNWVPAFAGTTGGARWLSCTQS